jgi:hypothetical protein
MIRPRQLARIGSFHLQEAILDVLCEHYLEGYGLGAAEISRRLGVYRFQPMNDAIVTGFLFELELQKKTERIEQEDGKGGWHLTTVEYERRRDDI